MRKKIVLIRLDKIGDLICTLPVDQVIDSKQYEVIWIVQKGMGAVIELGSEKRTYLELDKTDVKNSSQKLSQLLSELKPQIAISFQAPWWVNFALFKARIPNRAGVLSQWHSFLFLNKALRQKRSLATQHEMKYNLDLVRFTFDLKKSDFNFYFKIIKPTEIDVLQKYNLKTNQYIVVHPGMMGSALNWKQSQYISFIRSELLKMKTIVITGTPHDENYLNEIKKEFLQHPNVIWLQSKLNLKELIQILAHSEFVVAPSTGVAHLAASTGAFVKAIYSPIQVHHARRWGARGPHVQIYMPQIDCPATHQCQLEKCVHYNCMNQVSL